MASIFTIKQEGKKTEIMKLTICLEKALGDPFNVVEVNMTVNIGLLPFNVVISTDNSKRCFEYELDSAYENEIGKDITVQLFTVFFNMTNIDTSKIQVSHSSGNKVVYDNYVELSYNE